MKLLKSMNPCQAKNKNGYKKNTCKLSLIGCGKRCILIINISLFLVLVIENSNNYDLFFKTREKSNFSEKGQNGKLPNCTGQKP